MTHVTSILNGKGGTGKTSVTCNVAALAAVAGYKTLVVDLGSPAQHAQRPRVPSP